MKTRKQTTILNIPVKMHKKLKDQAAIERRTMAAVMDYAFEKYLKDYNENKTRI